MPSLAEFLDAPTRELPWPERIVHLSQSSIGMFNRCHEQFRQRYVLGNKEAPGESIVVGSFMHETLAWNYGEKILTGEDRPLSEALEYLHDQAIPHVLEEEGGVESIRWDTSLDTARDDSERITSAYYQTVVPRIQPLGVEERFELWLEGIHVPLIGYLDTREQERVIDTKTGKQVSTKVKPSWALQGKLYGIASGLPVEYHSINRAKQPRIVTALESEAMVVPVPTHAQAESLTQSLRRMVALISWYWETVGPDAEWGTTGSIPDFTRNMLPCDFCGFRKGCSAWA